MVVLLKKVYTDEKGSSNGQGMGTVKISRLSIHKD
jgi:hypothetical protein